jgi:hypothetical protein
MLSKHVKSEIYSIQLLDTEFKHEIQQYLVSASYCVFHVRWVLVTTAWHVLRLQKEEMTSRYGR